MLLDILFLSDSVACILLSCLGDRPFIELTQFPRIAIFHGQYNEPRSGEIELRQQQGFISDLVAGYFGVWFSQSYPFRAQIKTCIYDTIR